MISSFIDLMNSDAMPDGHDGQLASLLTTCKQQARRIEQLEILLDISAQMSAAQDLHQLLRIILDRACELLDAETASIFLVDEEQNDLKMALATNIPAEIAQNIRVPHGQGIVGKCVETGQTVFVPDVHVDPNFYGKVDSTTKFVTRSIICVPLHTRQISLNNTSTTPSRIIGAAEVLNKRTGQFTTEDVALFELLCVQVAVTLQTSLLIEQLRGTFFGVVSALAASIDAKDDYTHGHSSRVAEYSLAIARELALPDDQLSTLHMCAIMHDIGKIGIPDNLLKKPGALTDEEYNAFKRHTTLGYEIMRNVPAFREIALSLAQHHERIDGRGYPYGLSGDQIKPFARIIAVADAFDAMTSTRVYRPALSVEEAFRRLHESMGTQLDPEAVRALDAVYARGEITIGSETSSADHA